MTTATAALAPARATQPPRRSGQLLRRYSVLFAVMMSGGIVASGVIGAYASYEDNRVALTRLQMQKASAAANQIDQFFDEMQRAIASATPPTAVSRGLAERRDDYLRLLRLEPAITDVVFIDTAGFERVRVSRLTLTLLGTFADRSSDPPFTDTRSRRTYFGPPYFRDASEPYMTIAQREQGPDGGVTVAEVNLKFIWDVISHIQVGEAGKAYVVDRTGTLIAHPDISLVLRKTDLSSFQPVQVALTGGGAPATMLATDLYGQRVIVTSQVIRSVGWTAFVEQPLAEAFAGLVSSLLRTALLLMGGLSVGVVASVFAARRVVRPIQAMQVVRDRTEQELRIAREIQQSMLPRHLPLLPGWRVKAHYQPARTVGGDFYDVIPLADGRLGLVIGDVSGEGIPAALTMATLRTMLRSVVSATCSPGEVLARTNELLFRDVPPAVFATCLYAALHPATGKVRFANAGHRAAYQRHAFDGSVTQLRATGMPLGLMPHMTYPECEAVLAPGDLVVAFSDGLVEAHNPRHEMFGLPRIVQLIHDDSSNGTEVVDRLVAELACFTGSDWEQEDDLTVVVLERNGDEDWRILDEFELSSQPGNERVAIQRVADAVAVTGLATDTTERLTCAVGEAVLNGIEHGNHFRPEVPVTIRVAASDSMLSVQVTDHGGPLPVPPSTEQPDLQAKLGGLQSPRGWGLFLIQRMVDEVQTSVDNDQHTIDLRIRLTRTPREEQDS